MATTYQPSLSSARGWNRPGRRSAALGSAALGSAVLLMLVGCASLSPDEGEALEGKVDEAVIAYYLGPGDVTGGTDRGVMGLADAEGATASMQTQAVERGVVLWTPDGVHFSDSKYDYVVADTVERIESSKASFQNAGVYLEQSDTVVAVYNDAMASGGGYTDHLVTTRDMKSDLQVVEGDFSSIAVCRNQVFGISETPGRNLRRRPATAGRQSALLARLVGPEDVGLEAISWSSRKDQGWMVLDDHMPCNDGTIHALASRDGALDDKSDPGHPSVLRWNTRTGELAFTRLTNSAGEPIDVSQAHGAGWSDGDELWPEFDANSMSDATHLQWYTPSGKVYSTDVSTGVTRVEFDTGVAAADHVTVEVQFTPDSLYLLAQESEDTLILSEFDRTNGERVSRLEIKDAASARSMGSKFDGGDLLLRSFAVKPD